MRQNIELGSVREFGDIISDSFVILRQNFIPLLKAYFVICGAFLVTGILVTTTSNSQQFFDGQNSVLTFWGFLSFVFTILNYTALILTTTSYLVLYKEKGNQAPKVMEVWGYFRYYFFRVFGTQILCIIVIGIGTVLCFVPGLYLMPVFSLVIPIMVIENANAEYSIRRAFKIIKENWWLTFGTILLLSLLVVFAILVLIFVPAICIYGANQWLTGKNGGTSFSIIEAVVIHATQVLWMLPTIALVLVYYTLTEQKEATGLLNRIKTFGTKSNGTDQLPTEQY